MESPEYIAFQGPQPLDANAENLKAKLQDCLLPTTGDLVKHLYAFLPQTVAFLQNGWDSANIVIIKSAADFS